MISLLFILIFCVAILFSMLGLGGGILYVPMLLQAGLPFHEAAATSLTIIVVMSFTAAFIFHKNKLVDWKIVFILEPFSILGAFVASMYADVFSIKFLQIMFASVALISAFFMLKTPAAGKVKKSKFPGVIHRKMGKERYHINLWFGIPLLFLAGYISVLLGIGGGFAKVPMMTLLFGVPLPIAVATSTAMIVITALSGVTGYAVAGYINYELSIILAVAVFLGAFVGSKILVKADKKFINVLFSIILVFVAGWMLYRAFNG